MLISIVMDNRKLSLAIDGFLAVWTPEIYINRYPLGLLHLHHHVFDYALDYPLLVRSSELSCRL